MEKKGKDKSSLLQSQKVVVGKQSYSREDMNNLSGKVHNRTEKIRTQSESGLHTAKIEAVNTVKYNPFKEGFKNPNMPKFSDGKSAKPPISASKFTGKKIATSVKQGIEKGLRSGEGNSSGNATVGVALSAGATLLRVRKGAELLAKGTVKTAIVSGKTVVKVAVGGKNVIVGTGKALNRFKNAKCRLSFVTTGIKRKIKTSVNKGLYKAGQGLRTAPKRFVIQPWKKGKQALKTGATGMKIGTKAIDGALSSSDDMGAQTAKFAVKTAEKTVDGAKFAGKTIKTGVKAGVKTGKTIWKAGKGTVNIVKRLKATGFRNTTKHYRRKMFEKAHKTAGKAVKVVGKGVANLVKSIGTKIAIPLIVVFLIVGAVTSAITAPVGAVASIFGGGFSTSDTGEDFETHDYVTAFATEMRPSIVDKVNDVVSSNIDSYHIFRLVNPSDPENHLDVTNDNIMGFVPEVPILVQMMEPFFQTIIFYKYDLEPSDREARETAEEIWDKLFVITTKELPEEFCESRSHSSRCSILHADVTCPNSSTGSHGSYTCGVCCERDDDGEDCSYADCDGHKILEIRLSFEGYMGLRWQYFESPIRDLQAIDPRTEEQQEELQDLIDAMEILDAIYEELIEQYGDLFGGGGGISIEEWEGTTIIPDPNRVGNEAIIKEAKKYLGNFGGVFNAWYGVPPDTYWCAAFVSYCANKVGVMPTPVPKFNSCSAGISTLGSNSMYHSGNYPNPIAGDIIFFNWGGGAVSHVGLVMGSDAHYVYVIEGNSLPGLKVNMNKYLLDSSNIYGYGIMDY